MSDLVHVVGFVATKPKHVITSEGLAITSFRFASTARRYDRTKGEWADGHTNWFTVTAFRQLAINVASSVSKGERLIVSGRLQVNEWESGEKRGTNVEIAADAIGHDLTWGTAVFARSVTSSNAVAVEPPAATPEEKKFPEASPRRADALATPF